MMASRFINHFRNTFLVASTATLAQIIEQGVSPRLHRFHYLSPQAPAVVQCQCGNQAALRSPLLLHSTAPLHVSSMAVLATGVRDGQPGDKPPKKEKEGRGEAYNLLKVMHYFETVMPMMFDTNLFFLKYNSPQLYTPNVILENHLREPMKTARGLVMLLMWQNFFRLSYKLRYIANRLIILNQWIDPKEGTVTINFRILSVRKVKLRGPKPKEADEMLNQAFADNAEWHDFLLTLHVTNHDRVWKVVISQKNTERTPPLKTRFTNPLLGLKRRMSREPQLPLPV